MEHYEMRLLADYTHTGVQVANTWVRPTPRAVLGEIEHDERAEVVYMEISSPIDGGAEELLRKIIPVLDGQRYSEYVSLSGIYSSNMCPNKRAIWGGKLYSFGTPMSNNPLLSTTLKYDEHITFECLAGNANITGNYRIKAWGYVYKETELPTVFGTMVFPAYLTERARNRTLTLAKDPIPVTGKSWKTLPGGKDQSIPKINPFIRFAYNLNATDGIMGDYQFRYDIGNVADADENLFFDWDSLNALLVESIGIKTDPAPGNLAQTGLLIAGDYHPKGLIPTQYLDNPLSFGTVFPYIHEETGVGVPMEIPLFYAIPKLERPRLIWNEKGMMIVRDDGTAIPANALVAALTGIRIEMKG